MRKSLKTSRRITTLVLSIIIVITMIGCQTTQTEKTSGETSDGETTGTETTATAAPDTKAEEDTSKGDGLIKTAILTFALSTEQWQLMTQGCVDQGADFGFEVTVMDCAGNATKQVEQFESCIEAGYECIIVSPCDKEAIAEVGKTAAEKGIAVVCLDGPNSSSQAYVAADEYENAFSCGEKAGEWVNDNWPDKKELNICLLNYEFEEACVERAKGLLDGFNSAYEGNSTTVADISPVDAAEANTMCESVLQGNKVDVCLAIAADQLYGFCLAAENAGVGYDEAMGAAMDCTSMATQMLEEGKYVKIIGSWGEPYRDKSKVFLKAAQAAIDEVKAGNNITDDPIRLNYELSFVDESNVKQVRKDFGWE